MPAPIVTKDRIRAEFDRIKAQHYGFSDGEIVILVSANLLVPIESVQSAISEVTA